MLAKVNRLLDEVQGGKLLENGAATLAKANLVLTELQQEIHGSHIGQALDARTRRPSRC